MKSFADHSILELLALLKNKELTVLDIVDICINRNNVSNYANKAWAYYDQDIIMKQAYYVQDKYNLIEKKHSLFGIPIGVKDIFNTIDYPTQMGSPLWKGFTPGNDARIVYNIKNAGGIIAGKTDTAEFAVHALNSTVNPHNEDKTPGTSSSGSAALVALGVVPVALGSQTAASIVRPASFCGVYGCKPSFGTIPRTGVLKTADTLDSIGYFTIHLQDIRHIFDVLRVRGENYPICQEAFTDENRQLPPIKRPWKIGFVKGYVWDYAEEYAKNSINEWVQKLEASASEFYVEEVELPKSTFIAHQTHSDIYHRSLSYYFKEEYKESQISDIMRNIMGEGTKITTEKYLAALEQQVLIQNDMDELLCEYDVIISLSTAGSAPAREEVEKPDNGLIWTLAHLPVISAPVFLSPNKMPFGVQLASRKYSDYKLMEFLKRLNELDLVPDKSNPVLE
ncbi:hypothetical protein BHU72_05255 [Desulfuribacillus stibiiarsenatis]|uniref:Amidase domain-containing protein n=1 Tax=Desulfuribacillus stibiiarsenatis TaxID=1390249 RepID=A0A1E5L601_9FIRM|nr:amidase [Desulfuribacillus stibiiarsenatis]OEH85494.1 hypothetical protein BHU72_05255 [Desulfuribacillus stibiiarsenatis]